jgi:hypothetical protein
MITIGTSHTFSFSDDFHTLFQDDEEKLLSYSRIK